MRTVFQSPVREATAMINPNDVVKRTADFPPICITTFSKQIIDTFASKPGIERIAELYTANGIIPIYKTHYNGHDIAFYMSLVGAPACVSFFEEIVAMGAESVVAFGSCGILDDSVSGQIIVPISAIRDEGTSYHYIPASDEILADKASVETLINCLNDCRYAYIEGKTWTTDGIYRETREVINERKAQGCIAVDMECAALLAVSEFRQIPFIQFLYGADCLANEIWDPRDLSDHGQSQAEKLMTLAFQCGIERYKKLIK
ncbi:MAG: nucleoside phosphorylase [Lachnospiraceae bacterium]